MIVSLRSRSGWLPGALAVLLVGAATWKLTLGQRIIARGDLLLYFYPLRDYASAAIREARLPLWNPYTFMGAPFLANSQVGFFYPLNVAMAWVPVGQAVSWSIALHLAIAAAGMYVLARRGLGLGALASFASALAFGLGGYLGAQVEHLNQLQVLAWLPLEVLLLRGPDRVSEWGEGRSNRSPYMGRVALLALLIALQVLAGHTQSLYICLAALGLVVMAQFITGLAPRVRTRLSRAREAAAAPPVSLRRHLAPAAILVAAGALAALMAAVQLLPTAELATQSARSGGLPLNEVGSFSWRPWVMARALLPTYGDPLFPEYVAYLGAAGLALALLGALTVLARPNHTPVDAGQPSPPHPQSPAVAITLAVAGILLALGVVTPLFGLLYRLMPGFNLFRAQARWLVVFALGAAMLVGYGAQALQNGVAGRLHRVWLAAWLALMAAFILGLLAGARISPEPEYRGLPAQPVLLGWAVAAGAVTLAILLARSQTLRPATLFVTLLAVELAAASQFQPYARAADAEALTDLRPSTAHLLAGQALQAGAGGSQRVLALSNLFFDPGDLPEQTLIYGPQLSPDELYDRVIASKQKEILSPNLSLYYRLLSVDGYDGGLLPLKRYADFTQPFAAPGVAGKPRTADGRLREFLAAVPGDDWLARMAVQYVIADKTRDVFIDNVYYDLQFSEPLSGSPALALDAFESTALGVVLRAGGARAGDPLARAVVRFAGGETQSFDVRASAAVTQPYFGQRLHWDGRRTPAQIAFTPVASDVTLLGMTSIDEAAGTFLAQPLRGSHDMRLAHSGDVKIYENRRPAPRALLAALADCSTVNGELQVDIAAGGADNLALGTVQIVGDAPERLALDVLAEVPGWLVVRDAFYPGWVARIDGAEVPISSADTLFRAVQMPPGRHAVVFSYEPASLRTGAILSGAGVAGAIGLLTLFLRSNRPTPFGGGQRRRADHRRQS